MDISSVGVPRIYQLQCADTHQGSGLRRGVGSTGNRNFFFMRNQVFSPGPYDSAKNKTHIFPVLPTPLLSPEP